MPVIATNRINDPVVAEQLLAGGTADLISMARPLLADPEWPNKAQNGREAEINTCIACNQACLDRIFEGKDATCLVNPRAARETELILAPVTKPRRVCVVGAGPAGLACAVSAAERGHDVTLYEQEPEIGGQFRFAREVPGKEEFHETLRYYRVQLEKLGVKVNLGTRVSAEELIRGAFDEIVVAAGVRPRVPPIPGIDHEKVITYPDLLSGRRQAGQRVAIVGAGGIGFDVATFLTAHRAASAAEATRQYCEEWGIDMELQSAGGLLPAPVKPPVDTSRLSAPAESRTSWCDVGKNDWLGSQSRPAGARRGDAQRCFLSNASTIKACTSRVRTEMKCSTWIPWIVCAGQESCTELISGLPSNVHVRVIGGARLAAELDAERAIREGTELAATL